MGRRIILIIIILLILILMLMRILILILIPIPILMMGSASTLVGGLGVPVDELGSPGERGSGGEGGQVFFPVGRRI